MSKMKKVEESLKQKEEELSNKEKEVDVKIKMLLDKEKELQNKEKSLLEKEQYLNKLEKELTKNNRKEININELKNNNVSDLYNNNTIDLYNNNKLLTDSSITRSNLGREYSLKSSELSNQNEKIENINKYNMNQRSMIGNSAKNIEYTDITNLNVEDYLTYQQIANKTDSSTNPSTKSSNLTPSAKENQYLKSSIGNNGNNKVNNTELLITLTLI
jgi:hypothetical protein